MAAKVVDGDVKLDRFLQLRRWFGDIGCCWNCRDSLAFTQVDREGGSTAAADLSKCANSDKGAMCRSRANANRKVMPGRP